MVASNPGAMAFGMIGLIAAMPILSLEILGVLYGLKIKKAKGVENE